MIQITQCQTDDDLREIRVLFGEYIESLGFHLSFQDVEAELAELPGRYSPPEGRLLLARHDGATAGCVAMKKLGEGVCEMKRFFVRPTFRGKGIGAALARAIVSEGRSAGYRSMRLDTVPSMKSAINIYEGLGFRDAEPYVFNPVAGARYLELIL